MPALPSRSGHRPGRTAHVIVVGLLAMLIAALDLAGSDPVAARDWSPYIASLRNSQLYYESVMRGADMQIRATKHGIRRARRSLSRARQIVERRRDRVERARKQLGSLRSAWSDAKADLGLAAAAPRSLTDLSTALLSSTLIQLPPLAATGSDPTSVSSDPAQLAAEAQAYVDEVMAAQQLVAERGRDVRRQERTVARARHRLARAGRSLRQRAAHLAAVHRARRAAVARREGAEAGLGNAILGMSRYAQRRIAKKTNVRPGRTSGFSWPTHGRLTQGYGRHHDGIDIAGYRGTPIRAAAIGVISYIGWNPWDQHGRAFMIVVAHPGGLETLYGHALPTRAVRVGQVVKRGQVIGYMGSTGNSTGVHLHLELRRGRTTLNPLAYL